MNINNNFELVTSNKSNNFLKKNQKRIFFDYLKTDENNSNGSQVLKTSLHLYEKTHQSIKFTDLFYEEIVDELSETLNKLHNVKWNKRSWKILIGPWLIRFISVVYDRIQIIQEVIEKKNIDYTYSFKKNRLSLASCNMKDFGNKVLNFDWNDEIFARIFLFLKEKTDKNIFYYNHSTNSSNKKNKNINNYKYSIKFINYVKRKINEKNNYFLFNTYVGNFKNRIKLSFKLGEIPIRNNEKLPKIPLKHDLTLRKKLSSLLEKNISDDFKKNIIKWLLPECLPSFYFEEFRNILKYLEKSSFPLNKKTIVTANCWGDSLFKYWIACQSNQGSKILLLQHGGGYGVIKSLTQEKHEIDICDKYYSWGWSNNKKIYPGMIFQSLPAKIKAKSKNILLVTGTLDYFQWTNDYLYSIEKENEPSKKSFFWAVNFIEEMLNNISIPDKYNKIEIKLHPIQEKRGSPYSLKDEIENRFPKLKFSKYQKESVIDIIHYYELIIFAYPFATPFFHCLALRKPAIAFSPLDKNYIRDDARSYFQKMVDFGLYYDQPNKCAEFVNKNFNNFSEWEGSLRKKTLEFVKRYANFNRDNQLDNLKDFIKSNKLNDS